MKSKNFCFLKYLYDPRVQFLSKIILSISLMSFCFESFAAGGDILQGTDESLWATINGTGKNYIYAVEGVVALAAFIKTKNLLVFGGIIAVAIFINIFLSMAGKSL